MYHVRVTNFEELENTLNALPETEEVVTINTAGTQAVITTKDKNSYSEAENTLKKKQRLLEQVSGRIPNYD